MSGLRPLGLGNLRHYLFAIPVESQNRFGNKQLPSEIFASDCDSNGILSVNKRILKEVSNSSRKHPSHRIFYFLFTYGAVVEKNGIRTPSRDTFRGISHQQGPFVLNL